MEFDSNLAEKVHNRIQMGILVVNAQEEVVSCNDWLLAAANLDRPTVEGQPFVRVFPLLANRRLHGALREVLKYGRPVVLSQALNRRPLPLHAQVPQGPDVPMEQAISLVRIGEDDGSACCLIQVNDVTPMVAREKKLRQLNRDADTARMEVQSTAEQLDVLNLALQARSKDLTDFAHAAAHDLKAPMRHMAGLARIVADDCQEQLSESSQKYLKMLMEAGIRGTQVVEDLLRFAEARRPAQLKSINLNAMLDLALANLRQELETSGAQVTRKGLVQAIGYETGLMLVFQNLVANAIKYCTADTPQIVIESTVLDDCVEVRVSDNGVGVPEKDRESIFEPFRRVHMELADGSGIGLATCRRVLEDCGGRIWVEAIEGGSAFVFRCRQD